MTVVGKGGGDDGDAIIFGRRAASSVDLAARAGNGAMRRLLIARLALENVGFRARRRLIGESPLADVAQRSWEIAPAQTLATGPSLFLPDQVGRIRAVDRASSWEVERRRIFGGTFELPPVRAFEYANAALYRGAIVCRQRRRRIVPFGAKERASRDFPAIEVGAGALAGSYLGLQYFGHWLRDDSALSELAREFGEAISPSPPPWPHIAGYVDLLGLAWRAEENVRFRRLVMFDDEEYTSSKGERLARLRARARARLGAPPSGRRVFLKRGLQDRGARHFRNEDAVAEAMGADGFLVVDPMKASVEEIARALSGADLVVGVEGSQLAHATFHLKEGGGLLAVTSPDRFCTSNKRWTDLAGMRYGFLVGDPYTEGFTADIAALRRTIELFC